jgi:Fe-S-cluster containining protein
MSQIDSCPTCGAKCKVRRSDIEEQKLKALQKKDLLFKINQLKTELEKSKLKVH